MKKTKSCICPKCRGNSFAIEDYDFDGESIRETVQCQDCGAMWDEYHTLIYRGYAYRGVDYDENGEIMPL